MAEEVVGGRGECGRIRDAAQGHPREEAVVEEAAFQAEVNEGVEGMPDEEEAARLGDGAVERGERETVGNDQDGNGRGKRPKRNGVEEVGG